MRLLSPKDAATLTTLSWRTIQRKVRAGDFPAPVKIGDHRVAFYEAEVVDWVKSRPRVTEAA